jgi:hypothetical protein
MRSEVKWMRHVLVFAASVAITAAGCSDDGEAESETGDAGVDVSAGDAAEPDPDTGPACTPGDGAWCEPCTCDSECGEDGVCLDANDGTKYCSERCAPSTSSCYPGSYCKQFGATSSDFACVPLYGACTGDGLQCAPCESDSDCAEGHTCHESKTTGASDCYKQCTANDHCGDDAECDAGLGLCLPFVANKFREVCSAGTRELCEPCAYNYDCQAGMTCQGKICTVPCEALPGAESTCPKGLFCIGGFCDPPEAHGCQGWLGCAHACGSTEVCVKGFCKSPCETGCPVWQICDGEFCVDPPEDE